MKTFFIALIVMFISIFQLLLFPPHVYTETPPETQTVVSSGIGDSPQAAIQNAAENALTQVVGTFMNTETILKKRSEISGGIKEKTKELSETTKEYSQGSIKSFEVLESTSDNGLYRITAQVEVRIEDFKAFIAKLAEGSAKVDDGLFAQVSTQAKNKANAKDIVIKDILLPVFEGKATQFNVGKPRTADQELVKQYSHSPGMHKRIVNSETIVVPVEIIINEAFLQNAQATLESIVSNKKQPKNLRRPSSDMNRPPTGEIGLEGPRGLDKTINGYLAIMGDSTTDIYELYELKGFNEASSEDNYQFRNPRGPENIEEVLEKYTFKKPSSLKSYCFYDYGSNLLPNMQVSLIGANNEIIEEYLLTRSSHSSYGTTESGRISTDIGWESWDIESHHFRFVILIPKQTMNLFLNIPSEVLAKVKTINIKMVSK